MAVYISQGGTKTLAPKTFIQLSRQLHSRIMENAIPATMVAYRCGKGQPKPVAERIDVPTPASDEVLVKILAGGVCHTDLPLFDPKGDIHQLLRTGDKGFTAGHEGAGK